MTKNNAWNFDTTFTIGDILYASDSSTLSKLAIGSSGQVLGVSSGLPQWQTTDFQPSSQNFTFFEDALGTLPNIIVGMGQNGYSLVSSNGDASFATISGHPGVVELTTLTTSTAWTAVGFGGNFQVGGGTITHNAYYRIPTLSTSGNRFTIFLGYLTNGGGFIGTDGIWFEYVDNVNSGNWQIKTRSASTTTTANTSTAADTNWHKFTIIINAAGTSVAFYIDDVQVTNSPITTNIPSVGINMSCMITKSVGTTARTLQFDWYDQTVNLTNPRY